MESPSNSSLLPSAMDLLMAFPRLAQRAPEFMDNIAGKIFNGGSVIADATAHSTTVNSTITNTSNAFVQSTASTLESTFREAWRTAAEEESSSLFMSIAHGIGKVKQFGGIFSYLTSRWALTTFTAAIILNRTQFYASSREHLRLRFHMRLALYAVPVASFLMQLMTILQAMKCQTSPDFAQIRYGDPLKNLAIDFGGEGGFLYNLSSTLLFWQDDASCCNARSMSLVSLDDDKSALRGSLSLLYWFFLTLCTSQLFETLSCALQGKQPMPETGMTIFEHSLAFAECEAMISSALGFGFFGIKSGDAPSGENSGPLVHRSEILQRLNVPPEVLLVCLISCFSHLSSATLAVVGLRHKVRLVNTAIWACCYMAAFVWSFTKILMNPIEQIADLGVLRFPTVCVVGFIPHLLILVGIVVCGAIYGLALFVTALSVPSDAAEGLSFRQRLAWAYNNLQANVQFSTNSSIRIKMSEDFYTTLLKIGFNVLTAASEAVYLNEGSQIHVAPMTWIEQKRIDEIAANMDKRKTPAVPSELLGEGIARGLGFIDHQNAAIGRSPYARERKSRPTKAEGDRPNGSELDSGLGLTQRRSRMQLTFDFIAGIFWLVIGLQASLCLNMLRKLGIEHRPAWLLKAAGVAEGSRRPSAHNRPRQRDALEFYMLSDDGTYSLPTDNNFDVEVETRRRVIQAGTYQGEPHIADEVYRWWRNGGRFGDMDASGDFEVLSQQDDDTTSVISMSTTASTTDSQEDSGRRTPTQLDPFGDRSRESTPASEAGFDMGSLARLLNPQTLADREEARLLSHSLQADRPMTRSQYRRSMDRTRAELLSGLRNSTTQPSSEQDEETDLEHFILSQRSKAKARAHKANTWESGAEGMGEGGPQCVVCQSCPRTVLVWPCGCLSMCDDCRVGLAARNYTKCICCRTDIAAYSRLYVP
ncbi:hypothetical protein M409DRAFT_23771 [Zasmidium cellare ATCC 36951]|uniref:RING-type domain-containing protein n=1 Tax=Zasmidium cellare ATCC 36951 TaxID=1080233 RepID=A0A6A6CHC2_ZASCE|nr:uncharacterized protein M409DRAFT_23771 [Zasmidium cellare ATCC 36951]KAF2166043.1 hypothetical protein M409DRAFT_23771 [Zasmidium cellare ATCC 36951]